MIDLRASYAITFVLALSLGACAVPKEKTAPCKKPTNLTNYAAAPSSGCGPLFPVNPDWAAVLAAIDALQTQTQQGQASE